MLTSSLHAALWEFQSQQGEKLPCENDASELGAIADRLFSAANINKRVLQAMPKDVTEYVVLALITSTSPPIWQLNSPWLNSMLLGLLPPQPRTSSLPFVL